ncbi:MAG TPA: hypothetical protein PLL69_09570, partial [Gemmatimonadales bacterium]|nr:hypothetical protein [Gemmatimonadales bacterium]
MSLGEPLDTLAAAWAADPHPTRAAAIGDALRKRGDLRSARSFLNRATDRFPGSVPLWLAVARLSIDEADATALRASLGQALSLDPVHPVAMALAGGHMPDLLAGSECVPEEGGDPPAGVGADNPAAPLGEEESEDLDPVPVTESLAALYHRQGHLEQALAAYAELARRTPANQVAAERHRAISAELAATRPVPFDTRLSGGRSTGQWLAAIASV